MNRAKRIKDNGVSYNGSTADFDSVSVGSIPAIPVNFKRGVEMKKSKLFAICLTAMLMASGCVGCANSKVTKESSTVQKASEIQPMSDMLQISETNQSSAIQESVDISMEIQEEITEEQSVLEQTSVEHEMAESKQTEVILQSESPESSNDKVITDLPEIQEQKSSEQPVEEDVSESEMIAEESVVEYSNETESISETNLENRVIENSDAESSNESDEIEIWGIVKKTCTTLDGYNLYADSYVRVISNNLDDDICTIQWYENTTDVEECYIQMFEILKADTLDIIINKCTNGIVTPYPY